MSNSTMTRRTMLGLGAACAARFGMILPDAYEPSARHNQLEMGSIRSHFPILNQTVRDKPLIYFDTAATAQRPTEVINTLAQFYSRENANPAPNLHYLARQSFDAY